MRGGREKWGEKWEGSAREVGESGVRSGENWERSGRVGSGREGGQEVGEKGGDGVEKWARRGCEVGDKWGEEWTVSRVREGWARSGREG